MNFEANEFAAFRAQRWLRDGRCLSMDCDKGATAWWVAGILSGALIWAAVLWVVI